MSGCLLAKSSHYLRWMFSEFNMFDAFAAAIAATVHGLARTISTAPHATASQAS